MTEARDDVPTPSSREVDVPLNDPRILGEFISNLLGQRRSIERQFNDRRFEIDHPWLVNLHQVITQRLAAQNAAHLISFSARVFYANGRITTLSSEAAFLSYVDMSSELTVGIDLRWGFLIKFPLANVPEKQEIRFLAFADKLITERTLGRDQRNDSWSKSFFSFTAEDEELSYTIQFTDVTWGEDISAHIANYISSKTDPINKWKGPFRKIPRSLLFPISTLLGLLVMMWGTLSPQIRAMKELHAKYGDEFQVVHKMTTIDQKVSFLVDAAIIRTHGDIVSIIPYVQPIVGMIALWILFFLLSARKKSFINLNEFSDRYLKKYNKNYEFIKHGLLFAMVIGIVSALIGSRLYDLIKGV